MFFTRLIICIVCCLVGYYFVRKPKIPLELIGRLPFFEKYFVGGSTDAFQIIGVVLCLLGFAILTNVYVEWIEWFVNLLPGLAP